MAVIKKYYPDWKGPTHYEISPRWWIYWLKFGHRVGCGQFTSCIEQLLSCEKAGPSFPFPIEDDNVYEPSLPILSARERVSNYSKDTLDRLVPPKSKQYDFHGFRRTQIVDGLTQESYTNNDLYSFGGDENENNSDDEISNTSTTNAFSRSLEVLLTQKMGHARDQLKPYLEELYTCLDRLNDDAETEKIGKMIEDEVGKLRCLIAQSTQKRQQQVENVASVNVVVELRNNNPKRIKGTRHMQQYASHK